MGYLLTSIYNYKKVLVKLIAIVILTISVFYNSYLIQRDTKKLTKTSIKMEQFIKYIKLTTTDKNMKVAIIGPSHLLWTMHFVTFFYNTN